MQVYFGFDEAIKLIKAGKAVNRIGWNGKGMFVYLQTGSTPDDPTKVTNIFGLNSAMFTYGDTGTTVRLPCVCMRDANGCTVTGWLASQTDMLAEDWMEQIG